MISENVFLLGLCGFFTFLGIIIYQVMIDGSLWDRWQWDKLSNSHKESAKGESRRQKSELEKISPYDTLSKEIAP